MGVASLCVVLILGVPPTSQGLAMSSVASEALETQQRVDLQYAKRVVAARTVTNLFRDNRARLPQWRSHRLTLPLRKRWRKGRRRSRASSGSIVQRRRKQAESVLSALAGAKQNKSSS